MLNKQKSVKRGKFNKALLRLKSGKGSVLFLVVAIMTVLVVMASAVYYSVTSSTKQVEVKYSSEQAYQSALALNDIVTNYIAVNANDDFVQSIVSLNKNDTLTTVSGDGTGFNELAAGVGDYKITVTKLNDSGTNVHVIKIETEIDVNGESSVVTTVGEFSFESVPYTFDRFFTATGYAPNDVIMSGMQITSTLFLDNEYSQIGGSTGSSYINIEAEVIAAGTLTVNNAPINQYGTQTFDITVGNNLYMVLNGGSQGYLCLNGGVVRVGGNAVHALFRPTGNTDMYIVGDYVSASASTDTASVLYVNGDAAFYGDENYQGKVYVNGNLFIDKGSYAGNKFAGGVEVGGNIYLNQASSKYSDFKSYFEGMGYGDKIKTYNDSSIVFDATLGYEIIRTNMDEAISLAGGTGGYEYVWPTDTTCESLDMVIATLNEKLDNPEYLNWELESKFYDGDVLKEATNFTFADTYMQTLSADTSTTYVIGDVTRPTNQTCGILFDTTKSDGTYEDIYVYLKPNCYETSSGNYKYDEALNDTFIWGFSSAENTLTDRPFHVYVKGQGSVIFVVPDNVKYINRQQSFVGHIGLFWHINGMIPTATQEAPYNTGWFTESSVSGILDSSTNRFTDEYIQTCKDAGLYLHNNLFIVTVDKNAEMSFERAQNFFGGFIYAPYMTFTAKTSGQTGMVGGMIVSDYAMPQTSNTYVCTVPYDYYDRFVTASTEEEKEKERMKYLENLMSDSGANTLLGASTTRTWKKYGVN